MKALSKLFFTLFLLNSLSPFLGAATPKNVLEGNEKISSGTLHDYEIIRQAEHQLTEGNGALAINLLEKTENWGSFGFWRNVVLAQAFEANLQSQKALETLKDLPPPPNMEFNSDEDFFRSLYQKALLTQKSASQKLGKSTEQIDRSLWALFPDMGDFPKPLQVFPEDKVLRLHVLHEKKMMEGASAFINVADLHALKDESLRCRGYYELGNSLKGDKKMGEAVLAYSQAMNDTCEGEDLIKPLYWHGKIAMASKNEDEAIRAYSHFVRKFPHHRYTDDSLYALGNLYKSKGDSFHAEKALQELAHLDGGDMRARLFWEQAYQQYKAGQYKNALGYLESILEADPAEDESYPQALYWKGRILEKMSGSKKRGAAPIYHRLINDFPFSFYTILAANRMGEKLKPLAFSSLKKNRPHPPSLNGGFAIVDSLMGQGRFDEARQMLDYTSQTVQDLADDEHCYSLALKWIEVGYYNLAMNMASKKADKSLFSDVLQKQDPALLAFYPLAYGSHTKKGYSVTGLPKGAIEGIMREESLFKPTARSWVGATGLMQLMPATATIQARSINLQGFSLGKLHDPETNILLGATFFKKMLNLFEGNMALAIMSYNAGPGNVQKWLRENPSDSLDEFIEDCPFSETRGYVKRVLRSMTIYGTMMGEIAFMKPSLILRL